MKKTFACSVATLGFIGRFYGSGTIATIVALPLVYGLSFIPLLGHIALLILITIVAFKTSKVAVLYYGQQDPEEVVIDEVLGCLITFIGVPLSVNSLIVGFVLFRFFDISKWFGIRKFGQVRDAWGVLLDDAAAGLLSNFLLRIFFVWSGIL